MAKEDEQQASYGQSYQSKIRNLEEKQRVLKDRIVLIGNNLIENREETSKKISEMKKEIETLKESVERMKSFTETISQELSKFARKEDVERLSRQAKMFDPLNLKKAEKEE